MNNTQNCVRDKKNHCQTELFWVYIYIREIKRKKKNGNSSNCNQRNARVVWLSNTGVLDFTTHSGASVLLRSIQLYKGDCEKIYKL